jgi:hypothetical protein
VASCTVVAIFIVILANPAYQASYAGSVNYEPSDASARLD